MTFLCVYAILIRPRVVGGVANPPAPKHTRNLTYTRLHTMAGIYILTNRVNGMKYVGCTLRDIQVRVDEHLSGNRSSTRLIANAIKLFGKHNFDVKKINCDGYFPAVIASYETNLITSLNTLTPNGYNVALGDYSR